MAAISLRSWIDEMRYYSIPLSANDAMIAYGKGLAIWVPTPRLMHLW